MDVIFFIRRNLTVTKPYSYYFYKYLCEPIFLLDPKIDKTKWNANDIIGGKQDLKY